MFAASKRRPFLIYLACLVLLGILGWLDYRTGHERGVFVFYSIPIGIAALESWTLAGYIHVFAGVGGVGAGRFL